MWGHQFFHKYPFNTLICKQLLLTNDVGVYSMVYKQCEYLLLEGGFYYFRMHEFLIIFHPLFLTMAWPVAFVRSVIPSRIYAYIQTW